MNAIMFSGQGAQKIGMGKVFYDKYDFVKDIYNKASEICGFDVAKMCFEENDKLNTTRYAQPCIYTTNYAMYKVIEKDYNPDFLLGLSLGEYNAYQVASAFSFEDGLKLIKRRGEIMEEAFTGNDYGMMAIINMKYEKLKELLENVTGEIYIANYNTPKQIVISGKLDLLEEFAKVVKENKGRAIKLNVSGAFHSPLLNDASKLLAKEFDNIQINETDKNVFSNYTGNIETEVKDTLINQLTNEVKFCECITNLIEKGVTNFIEVGTGKTLVNFVKQISKEVNVVNIEELELNDK